jgi:predicted amidohydrolase
LSLFLCLAAYAAPALHETQFVAGPDGAPAGWTRWAPRDEIAPRTWVDADRSRTGAGSLAISGASNPGAYGGWDRLIPDVTADSWYRVTAYYQAQGLDQERQQALVRLAWRTADSKTAGRPDYAYKLDRAGEWTRLVVEAPAPAGASAAVIELRLEFAPQGSIWWDDISFEPIDTPAARPVRLSSVNLRPRETYSKQKSLEAFAAVVEREVPAGTDVILLPEAVTLIGTGKTYTDVAAPVPGPDTEFLGKLARAKRAYLVAGVLEREGALVYNTSVLLDRDGKYVGKYRKVYLPREEIDGGVTPGEDYPTFATDFGRVGMMICWDVQYADPARALALRGAELVLMPIWGGNETLAAARAIENHVFLAASGYDHPTYVMDPMGEMLSRAPKEGTVANATIDLAKRYEWPWLGSMRGRFFHELRRDVTVDPGRSF